MVVVVSQLVAAAVGVLVRKVGWRAVRFALVVLLAPAAADAAADGSLTKIHPRMARLSGRRRAGRCGACAQPQSACV